ncbi:MAG TPA: alcohol dehydrogenase catalytic domain-containing protein [Eubacteriales bacterium]|nr:alcohol dehydrogenase catalytic domain-containing protein [Eubacteriales bacterium]
MKAWTLVAPRKLKLVTSEPTELTSPTMAKVKIERALLSNTDFDFYVNPVKLELPLILGRYGAGVVSKLADENSELTKADRVVITPTIPCQSCFHCLAGSAQKCENLRSLGINTNGVFRDFIDLPVTSLHKLPETVSFEKALFTGYISLALNILDILNIEKGDHIAIYSETKLGLIIAQLITYYGAVPILIDKDNETLKLARELGIFYTFNYVESQNFKEDMFNITSGRMCEKVIYLTNSQYPLNDILEVSAFGASICLALNTEKMEKINLSQITSKQLHIYSVNTYEGNFPAAINILATNKIDTSCLIGNTVKFSELDKQIEKMNTDDLRHKSMIVDID